MKQNVRLKPLVCVIVTPRAGVWIETRKLLLNAGRGLSLPVRECGLKRCTLAAISSLDGSLPVRECGLKPCGNGDDIRLTPSLPVRECGLKPVPDDVKRPL